MKRTEGMDSQIQSVFLDDELLFGRRSTERCELESGEDIPLVGKRKEVGCCEVACVYMSLSVCFVVWRVVELLCCAMFVWYFVFRACYIYACS